jgi:hypothetical protein
LERTFQLAASDRFATVKEVKLRLHQEGYDYEMVQRPLLYKQLTGAIEKSRAPRRPPTSGAGFFAASSKATISALITAKKKSPCLTAATLLRSGSAKPNKETIMRFFILAAAVAAVSPALAVSNAVKQACRNDKLRRCRAAANAANTLGQQ